MSKRLVIILWSIVGVLAALVLLVKANRNRELNNPTKLSLGDELLAELPIKDVDSVQIEDAANSTTLTRGDNQWSVAERDGFKADFSKLSGLFQQLTQTSVVQNLPAGPAFNARFGMDDEAGSQENHGFKITFFNEAGEEIESLAIGKSTSNEAIEQNPQSRAPTGRYVRLSSEPGSVYSVTAPFYGLSGEPEGWIDASFIQVKDIQSVTFSAPNEDYLQDWSLTRGDVGSDFSLKNPLVGRELDPSKIAPIKNVLSNPVLSDVLTEEEAKERQEEKLRELVINTFDGFRYVISYASAKEDEANPVNGKQIVAKVTTSAQLVETRAKKEGESEEEAKKAEEDFAAKLETLKEKLAREQAFNERYYLLADYLISPVNIGAEELTKAVADPAPEPEAPFIEPAGLQSVVSPPVAVPAATDSPADEPNDPPIFENLDSLSDEEIQTLMEGDTDSPEEGEE